MAFVSAKWPALVKHFADGADVQPAAVKPVLQRVLSGTWEADLFRLASLTWSVPVSSGFGRRIRYLVWDESNEKLIGLAAIGDPVYNLGVRDELIGWTVTDRARRLVNVMDAYVLGAIPPYNLLLGGKLVACLLRSREVYDDFARLYRQDRGHLRGGERRRGCSRLRLRRPWAAASLYNRLRLGETTYFRSIGYTGGWGHFHIPDDLFSEMREYVREIRPGYADQYEFGEGPNWRLRTVKEALRALGFKDDLMRHGIEREVFICETARNALKLLAGKGVKPNLSGLLTTEEVGTLAVERWLVGRAERRPEFAAWKAEALRELLTHGDAPPVRVAEPLERRRR